MEPNRQTYRASNFTRAQRGRSNHDRRTPAVRGVSRQFGARGGRGNLPSHTSNFAPLVTGLNPRAQGRDPARPPQTEQQPGMQKRQIRVELRQINIRSLQKQQEKREEDFRFSAEQAIHSKLLLQEESGYLELEPGENFSQITQRDVKEAVDMTSATKCFDLSLAQFGPYKIDYTRNGRHLVIGGRKGHVACIDWITKRLLCEVNVMEEIHEIAWLHQETMFAVAQKDWVYMYDNQGIELHCIKQLKNILKMEFLPFHFLLATASDRGHLNWLDVSIGKMIGSTSTHHGRLSVMCQNPCNAVLVLGHGKGNISMWSPNVKEPLVSMLCHTQPVTDVAVHQTGKYLATCAIDRSVKIWDLRTYKCLQNYKIPVPAHNITFSQRGLLAVGMGYSVQIYKDCCEQSLVSPYICHSVGQAITDMVYCPYEDVLGIGHTGGFSSILIPGAGEPNFDTLEGNPFQTRLQRREKEVKSLLDKIQPEMIVLDPYAMSAVQTQPLIPVEEKSKSTFEPRFKAKGKSSAANRTKRKTIVKGEEKRNKVKEGVKKAKKQLVPVVETRPFNVLNRFKKTS